jgi:adenylosuccinate lyase
MDIDSISPLDNRYFDKIKELSHYFSYKAWVFYRLLVEVDYLKSLVSLFCEKKDENYYIEPEKQIKLFALLDNYTENYWETDNTMNDILDIEISTKHDIKAIEYSIANYLHNTPNTEYWKYSNLIHFGLTSQDVNSVAFSLQLKSSMDEVILPMISTINTNLFLAYVNWKDITMLAYTHGQPAIPTKLGKELNVFSTRLSFWILKLKKFTFYTKIGGAVGNLSAHKFTYPDINWNEFFDKFIQDYDMKRWKFTTQITNYDDIIELFSILQNINNVLIDYCQDMWLYISKKYFTLKKTDEQVGSSTMPQKVNPIDFENAEGNLKLANAGLSLLISKLPVSRLQRDLTDSTTLRNVGTYMAHCLLAYKNIMAGINKLEANIEEIKKDLEEHPECMSEAIQMILRKHNVNNGYDIVRKATQNKSFRDLEHFKEVVIQELENRSIRTEGIINKINELEYTNY